MAASDRDVVPSSDVNAPPELGPFDPPADYAFEPELRDTPPRIIPAELREGRYARKQRLMAWGLLVAGLLCAGLGLLPVVQLWGVFVLPLKYLTWIGVGCAAIAAMVFGQSLLVRGPYRYVEEGVPLVARIRRLALTPTALNNGQPVAFRFVALIEYRDPDLGEVVLAETPSNDIGAGQKDELTTSYRVGDYATAVYLPHDLPKTLRLYGFLDLKPGLGLVRRDSVEEAGLLKTLLVIVCLFGFFGALFWNIYAFGRYYPLELTFAQGAVPFALGAAVLGVGCLAGLAYHGMQERNRRETWNEQAAASGEAVELEAAGRGWFGVHGLLMGLVLTAGGLGLGGATMLCWAFTANALLDTSPAELRPVHIEEMIETTHAFLFRDYQIKYALPGSDETHSLLSTPDHMDQFMVPFGLAEVHSGRFGWPWVRTIRPLRLNAPLGPADDDP